MGVKARFVIRLIAVSIFVAAFGFGGYVFLAGLATGDPTSQIFGVVVAGIAGVFLLAYFFIPRPYNSPGTTYW